MKPILRGASPVKADAKRTGAREPEEAAEPTLAESPGRTTPDAPPLWEDEHFAVTEKGLQFKTPDRLTIPTDFLWDVGLAAETFPVLPDIWIYRALHHALMIHYPERWPNGLRLVSVPEFKKCACRTRTAERRAK